MGRVAAQHQGAPPGLVDESRPDAGHRLMWGKAPGGLVEKGDVSLVGTAPNSSDETTAGSKHAGNFVGSSGSVDHIHQTERGQYTGIASAQPSRNVTLLRPIEAARCWARASMSG